MKQRWRTVAKIIKRIRRRYRRRGFGRLLICEAARAPRND
jgi:hypothetical protein